MHAPRPFDILQAKRQPSIVVSHACRLIALKMGDAVVALWPYSKNVRYIAVA
jgi:hypothetical protein